MNWFQRYGIPGAFFIMMAILWAHALYPCHMYMYITSEKTGFLTISAIVFLPIGYMITILNQLIYLHTRGIHAKAIDAPTDKKEWQCEAELFIDTIDRKLDIAKEQFVKDWISRWMDVIAINMSILYAAALAILFVLLLYVYLGWNEALESKRVIVVAVGSVLVLLIAYGNVKSLSTQLKLVISSIQRKRKLDQCWAHIGDVLN